MPPISAIEDWQWCFPSRRQQAGVSSLAAAKAAGATDEQPTTNSTKMASGRRIPNRTVAHAMDGSKREEQNEGLFRAYRIFAPTEG
jgi:hypothetical protein